MTQTVTEVTRSATDIRRVTSLASFRATSSTTMMHSSLSSSPSSSSSRPDLVNNHVSTASKAIESGQTLGSPLDSDLGLGNIDVVGVDIADQTATLIDVVRMNE